MRDPFYKSATERTLVPPLGSTRVIYKYALYSTTTEMLVPQFSKILKIGVDSTNQPCVWFEVTVDAPNIVAAKFRVIMTGEHFSNTGYDDLPYIDSFFLNNGNFVGHVYGKIFE